MLIEVIGLNGMDGEDGKDVGPEQAIRPTFAL